MRLHIRLSLPLALIVLVGVLATPLLAQTRHGDTTFVKTTGRGLWGQPRVAIEELRVGETSGQVTLGAVRGVAAAPSGGVFVFDAKALDGPAIMAFDSSGRYVRKIGHAGPGPGEYGGGTESTIDLAAGPDGKVYFRAAQVVVYARDGRAIATIANLGGGSSRDLRIGADNTVFLRKSGSPFEHRYARDNFPFIRYSTEGTAKEAIDPPHFPGLPEAQTPYQTRELWTVLPDGRFVLARTDQVGFVLEVARGVSGRLKVEAVTDTVRYLPAERAELQAFHDWQATHPSPGMPSGRVLVPEAKQAVTGLIVDPQGRIWLRRSAPGVKGPGFSGGVHVDASGHRDDAPNITYEDPPRYSAFNQDGTYLGEISFPFGTRYISFFGNVAWGVTADADDVPILVKFRLPATP